MSFLLDSDICSAHLKRPAGLMHRFVQHAGRLHIASIALAELYVWAYRRQNAARTVRRVEEDLLADVAVVDFDAACAQEFGKVRAKLLGQGSRFPRPT